MSSQSLVDETISQSDDRSKYGGSISPQYSEDLWADPSLESNGETVKASSQLAISAKEFVPSRLAKDIFQRTSGLSSTASEWVPAQQASTEFALDPEGGGTLNEELVEVS